jgi:RNA polymerase sigma-70 factor, ECF subfamily
MRRSKQTVADEFLVIAARQGDVEALGELLERWQDRLWRFVCSLTGDEHDAREVYQDTCIAIARGISRLNDVTTFPKWAFTIASRRYADLVRRAERNRRVKDAIEAEPQSTETEAASPNEQRLQLALEGLVSTDRRLLCLAYLEEWSHQDLASLLGIPIGTVKSRLHRARQKLREQLETKD